MDVQDSGKYTGEVIKKKKSVKKKSLYDIFDWAALTNWFLSLFFALIPFPFTIIARLANNEVVDFNVFQDIVLHGDFIWIFATLLLFAWFDSFSKRKTKKSFWIDIIRGLGLLCFVFAEGLWVLYSFIGDIKSNGLFLTVLGVLVSACCLLIATPLKIDFIKR